MTNTTITIADPTGKGPLANGATYVVPAYTSYVNKSFTSITEVTSNVNSSYNAFVAEIQNRSLRSIQFDVNYTWSHALDYNQNATTTNTANSMYDPNGDHRADYGNSNYNVPNRLAGYVLYNLPNTHRGDWVKYLANDWAVNSSFQMQNGLPYSAIAERLRLLRRAVLRLERCRRWNMGSRDSDATPTSTRVTSFRIFVCRSRSLSPSGIAARCVSICSTSTTTRT